MFPDCFVPFAAEATKCLLVNCILITALSIFVDIYSSQIPRQIKKLFTIIFALRQWKSKAKNIIDEQELKYLLIEE